MFLFLRLTCSAGSTSRSTDLPLPRIDYKSYTRNNCEQGLWKSENGKTKIRMIEIIIGKSQRAFIELGE